MKYILTLILLLIPWTIRHDMVQNTMTVEAQVDMSERLGVMHSLTYPDTGTHYKDYVLLVKGRPFHMVGDVGAWLGVQHPDSHLVGVGTVRRMIDSALREDGVIEDTSAVDSFIMYWDTTSNDTVMTLWRVVAEDSTCSKKQESLDVTCVERGHVWEGSGWRTLMCCPEDRIVDLPDRTLLIHTDPNDITRTCRRCGKTETVPDCDTTVIWREK